MDLLDHAAALLAGTHHRHRVLPRPVHPQFDRLPANDLEQASAVMAWFVYHAAARPEMLHRKPLPKPRGTGERRGGRQG
jgi:hypothetical protein